MIYVMNKRNMSHASLGCEWRQRRRSRGERRGREGVLTPTKDTASVEFSSTAKGAATAKPEALEPGRGRDGRRPEVALQDDMPMGKQVLQALPPHRDMVKHGCRPDQEDATERTLQLRDTSLVRTPTAVEMRGTCKPRKKPP